jgi:hypothetical protein
MRPDRDHWWFSRPVSAREGLRTAATSAAIGLKCRFCGKEVIETPAKVETGTRKYPNTSFVSSDVDGKKAIEEIWVGGTTTQIILK